MNEKMTSLFDTVNLHRTEGQRLAALNLKKNSAVKRGKNGERIPSEETPRDVKQQRDFKKIDDLDVRTHRSLDLTKQRGHEKEKANLNAARKQNKDDEKFDDLLFEKEAWKDGFPEVISNNKYYRKKMIPINKDE